MRRTMNVIVLIFTGLFILLFQTGSNEATCASPNNNYAYSLNSDRVKWQGRNENGSVKFDAIVPGGIYTDLMRSKIIDDVLEKDNDVNTRWVAKENWTYSANFNVDSKMLKKNTINLAFYGLDTFANVSVNGHYVGMAQNMFIKYTFDVKKYLMPGQNTLSIQFYSPIQMADILHGEEIIPPNCVPDEYRGECHVNQLRKMQASFSWDWGPAFPSVGIWKSVQLEAYNGAIIADVTTHVARNDSENAWHLDVRTFLQPSAKIDRIQGHLITTLEINGNGSISVYKFVNEKTAVEIEQSVSLVVYMSLVSPWWPNGYGNQTLYNLKVTFQSTDYPEEYFSKNVKIGFRTVKLIQEPISDSKTLDGLTFYFEVNDHPIFMKGSNWIPMHILPELGYEKDKVNYLLESAKSMHSNMLRVWGGGVYESDHFYEKCDELGILVWQDLMYACNMYPANEKFLSSVSEEIKQVVRRLQHHSSIALWAGNNENEVALRGNWYGTASKFEHYKAEYVKLYVDTIRPIVLSEDPTRQYLVSSPSNGLQSEKEGFVAENPYDPRFGDNHYYNYLQDLWSMDTYPKTRFCSEYGFQSIPSLDTLRTATNNITDLEMQSDFVKHRQHHPNGYNFIIGQVQKHLTLPEINDVNYFDSLVYLSQINQAMAMKTETEFYRISRYDWMTMGALYWQLNDVWQAPSWSSIEYTGRWKMLHYYARDFFSPVLVTPRLLVTNEISIYIINDKIEPIINATLKIDVFKWNSLTPLSSNTTSVTAKGLTVEKLDFNIVVPRGDEKFKTFYRFSLSDANSVALSPFNYIFPVPVKDIQEYKKPNIKITITSTDVRNDGKNDFNVKITTDGIGLFVWLEVPYSLGTFSENGFILTEASKNITFYSNKSITKDDLKNNVKIKTY